MTAPRLRNIRHHYAAGDAPRIGFTQLAPPTRSPAPAPLFMLGPSNAALHIEMFFQTEVSEVGTYTIGDATLAPTGIAMKGDVAFTSPTFNHAAAHVAPVATRLLAAAADLPLHEVRGPLAVIYGPGHDTYGHWLVDFLPRLWVLAQTGHDIFTLRYAVPPEFTDVAARLLARLGVRTSQLVPYRYWREVLRTDLLLMPTGLRTENRLSPLLAPATAFWTAPLLRSLPRDADAPTRLFLSRAGISSGRVLTNRDAIETLVRQRGYTVIAPETLKLTHQAALFAAARIVVGEYGSALHGTVYSAPGTITVGLRGTSRHPSLVQSGLAAALGQHVGYVLGHTEGETEQTFSIEPEDFERALDIAEAAG